MTHYNNEFYQYQWRGAYNSACEVVPLINKMYAPKTVVDIGGGVGAWCKAFEETGVTAYCVDGDYTPKQMRLTNNYIIADLEQPLPLNIIAELKPDVTLCLEVAEHLTPKRAETFVTELTSIADIVVFSAAIPGQGGTNHINEQPHEYWHELFTVNGFKKEDVLRLAVAGCNGVEWWYKQNICTYRKK